jgi:putative ABC transport system permease protein
MIRHLLMLTWNRRRTNVLLLVEIFAAFLALTALSTLGAFGWHAYHEDRGYSLKDVWRVRVQRERPYPDMPKKVSLGPMNNRSETPPAQGPPPRLRDLLATITTLPQVVDAAAMDGSEPYAGWRTRSSFPINQRQVVWGEATDNLPAVLGITLRRGRWFGTADNGAPYRPVVITQQLARAQFGEADPIGQTLQRDPSDEPEEDRTDPVAARPAVMRVVGLVREYLPTEPFRGGYEGRKDFLFERLDLDRDPGERRSLPTVLVKARPGTPVGFEQTLRKTIQSVARGFYVEVTHYEHGARRKLDQALTFFAILAVLAGFLLIMVTLGLSGVVWQNVTARTAEIGLRRAQGATAGDIRRQFLGELAALASVAMAAGAVVVLHFAGLISHLSYFSIGWLSWKVYAVAFAFSALAIYVLVMLAGFLPAHRAARIQPLQALRQE